MRGLRKETNTSIQQQTEQTNRNYSDQVFDRKVDLITAGLRPHHTRTLRDAKQMSRHNAMIICDYILAMNIEVNPSDNYKRSNIVLLVQFCKFHNQKPLGDITREDLLSFLDSIRKPESLDTMHKWVGTYNNYRIHLMRFFKWLYYPDIEAGKRSKPAVIENVPQIRRKEKSIYKPTDLWTNEEDLLFLRYCPSSRIRCYHAVERDTGCRPHEILDLKIKEIVFKTVNNNTRQYAQISVNGKTGNRSLPLIDSLPYIKDYLNSDHPQPGNPNAVFICGEGKSLGRRIGSSTLYYIYAKYKYELFPKLLDNPNVPPEDKQKLKELLKKPWNPYVVGRHASLTQKSRILKEATLRVFSGWTADSDMPRRYTHLFDNAACEDILEAYGLLDKGIQQQQLRSKQCPNCNEPNKPDSRFCNKCKMILSYDAYNETLQEQEKQKLNTDKIVEAIARIEELEQRVLSGKN
jgi:integrase/recombinase XerD